MNLDAQMRVFVSLLVFFAFFTLVTAATCSSHVDKTAETQTVTDRDATKHALADTTKNTESTTSKTVTISPTEIVTTDETDTYEVPLTLQQPVPWTEIDGGVEAPGPTKLVTRHIVTKDEKIGQKVVQQASSTNQQQAAQKTTDAVKTAQTVVKEDDHTVADKTKGFGLPWWAWWALGGGVALVALGGLIYYDPALLGLPAKGIKWVIAKFS